eukprot:3529800-Pyramimonas_sp.AAC.1
MTGYCEARYGRAAQDRLVDWVRTGRGEVGCFELGGASGKNIPVAGTNRRRGKIIYQTLRVRPSSSGPTPRAFGQKGRCPRSSSGT